MPSLRDRWPLLILLLGFAGAALGREPTTALPQTATRARTLGVPFEGEPGRWNSITDVAGVKVGYTTLISGEGKLDPGKGPVRTGVTAVLPRGERSLSDPCYAGAFSLNGNGEMTGTAWVEESGFLEGPIVLTNTHSVGLARDAVVQWRVERDKADATGFWWSLPVVAETWDGYLNDINGFHVKPEHVRTALEKAIDGSIAEGNVGGGTGMIAYEFKGGTGTASRVVKDGSAATYVVGVLVQANCGRRSQLTISGVPVGHEITENQVFKRESGSIIIVVATDAPLLPHQLKRLAKRATHGLARTGATSGNGSGDLFLAFSTANPGVTAPDKATHSVETVPNDRLDPLFDATVSATEEAIVNALVAAQPMSGRDGRRVDALPHDRLRELLRKYNRAK